MSADDTYDEQVSQTGFDVSHWPAAGYVGEDGITHSGQCACPDPWRSPIFKQTSATVRLTCPEHAGDIAFGLALGEFLNSDLAAAMALDHRSPVPVAASLDPWTVEMLAAIADANEAYEAGDCE